MIKCKIRWVDKQGNLTPDDNEAIGRAWMQAHTEILRDGRTIIMPQSDIYPICAEHYKRFHEPGMQNWRFEGFTPAA